MTRTVSAPDKPPLAMLIAAFAAVYIVWGSTYLGIRFAIDTLPPLLMAGVRFSLAGMMVYGWTRWRGAPTPNFANWRAAVVVGGCLLLGGNGLICWAELHVPSGMTALLVATVPLWMVLLDWLLFHGTRPTKIIAFGLAIGLLGVFVLVNPIHLLDQPIHPVGGAAILIACLSWSIGSLYSRRAPLPKVVLLATGMEMLGGGILLLLVGTLRGEWAAVHPDAISLKSILAFFYLIVFGSLIGFSAYIWLLKVTSPAAVSTYAYVNPVVAVLLGWALAHEPIGPRTLIAAALIIAAVILITARRAQPVASETAAAANDAADPCACAKV